MNPPHESSGPASTASDVDRLRAALAEAERQLAQGKADADLAIATTSSKDRRWTTTTAADYLRRSKPRFAMRPWRRS